VVNAKLPKGAFERHNRKMTELNSAIHVNFLVRINQSFAFYPHYAAPVEPAVGRME
jgi:hypothetical protein